MMWLQLAGVHTLEFPTFDAALDEFFGSVGGSFGGWQFWWG